MENQSKKQTVKLGHFFHNEAKQIRLDFFYDQQLIDELKVIPGIKWSKGNKCWYILNNKENLIAIFETLKGMVKFDTSEFFRKKAKKSNDEFQLSLPLPKNETNYLEIVDEYILALEAKS
jgi:hypothetical protein